jgi:hypothetical protein
LVIDVSCAIAEKVASNEPTVSPPAAAEPEGPAEAGASEAGAVDGSLVAGGAVGEGVAAAPLQADTMIEMAAKTGRETVRALK